MMNYALVIYEMVNLNDIGLISLQSIMRGSIRIERNPVLCYVDTIDWTNIVHSGDEHYIKGNKAHNECPLECSKECPTAQHAVSPVSKSTSLKSPARLCWTDTQCQKICNNCDRSGCLKDGTCCDKQCLGGCSGPNSKDCFSCKGVRYRGICLVDCPPGLYKYLDRRCVTEQMCRQLPRPRGEEENVKYKHPWRPFNDSCVLECPPGYSEKQVVSSDAPDAPKLLTCEKCNGTCEKVCDGSHVRNIATAQRLRGCTIIDTLEIEIRGGKNLVKELEENLQSIREITGYLKIVRSYPLVSLNFLRNLKVIHGMKLDNDKSLVVVDNENLQKLWDWPDNATFALKRGKVLFHLNPKLCRREIESLRIKANLSAFDDHEVPLTSNGDKVACEMGKLNLTITKTGHEVIILQWNAFVTPDPRNLLGYVIYRTEAPYQNVTLYDGRDACGGDGWIVDDVNVPASPDGATPYPKITHIVPDLKPFTQYALYVRTYMISRTVNVEGAQSDIIYFRTKPYIPSPPKDLTAHSNSSSEILIAWRPPDHPNGNVTKYIIQAVMEDEEPYRNDYCKEPLIDPRPPESINNLIPKTTPPPSEGEEKLVDGETCSCSSKDDNERKKEKESESENEANFEDEVHNMIYVRRPPNIARHEEEKRKKRTSARYISDEMYYRYKRSVDDVPVSRFPDDLDSRAPLSPNSVTFKPNCTENVCFSLRQDVFGKTTFLLKNLYHFARYSIKVSACRDLDPSEKSETAQNCSPEAFIQARTLFKESADIIPKTELVSSNSTKIFKWVPPPQPNGIIVKYQVKVQTENVNSIEPIRHCLPQGTTSFVIGNLPPGNYSIQVSATSLLGPGNFTAKTIFQVLEASSSDTTTLVYVFVSVIILFIFVLIGGFYARKTWCPPPVPPVKLITSINPDYHSATYYPDEWEVPRESVVIIRDLAQGSFGMVCEGIIRNCPRTGIPEQPCAIKTVNEHANERDRIEFLNEASVMKAFKTHHVVQLLGVVSQSQPVLVLMELMAKGDLRTFLRDHRPDESNDPNLQPPTAKQILRMAMEIADGMAYLSAKKFVHRDLAARNCMVAEDMTVKIGDFGMTRDIYETDYYRKDSKGLLPVRWMAPESLKDGVYTSASDVWSYGVVLWEMATWASQPYQGMANGQVLHFVKNGGVMEKPEPCPEKLYDLMRRCWQYKQSNRPTFLQLVEMLLPEVGLIPSFNARSFYHSPEAQELLHPPEHGLAPLEEGEVDADGDVDVDIEAISPRTPLRTTMRDIDDFVVDGSDSETEQMPDPVGLPVPAPSSYVQYHKTYSSDSSRDSKASNGSSANANANTANGYIHDHWHRHGNGATSHTPHPSHSSHHGPPPTLKTTEC